LRADWEAEAGSPFDPAAVPGIAFGFSTVPDMPNSGEIWIDDVQLIGFAVPIYASPTVEIAAPPSEAADKPLAAEEPESGGGGLCPGSMVKGVDFRNWC
ncbi:MAG: hypothetical protein MUO67_13165, partial [Anaerolineales bacterium]|nr:hypothetical protein [Anaerolineales bacterium]